MPPPPVNPPTPGPDPSRQPVIIDVEPIADGDGEPVYEYRPPAPQSLRSKLARGLRVGVAVAVAAGLIFLWLTAFVYFVVPLILLVVIVGIFHRLRYRR